MLTIDDHDRPLPADGQVGPVAAAIAGLVALGRWLGGRVTGDVFVEHEQGNRAHRVAVEFDEPHAMAIAVAAVLNQSSLSTDGRFRCETDLVLAGADLQLRMVVDTVARTWSLHTPDEIVQAACAPQVIDACAALLRAASTGEPAPDDNRVEAQARFNRLFEPAVPTSTVIDLFERQAAEVGGRLAVVDLSERVTYGELLARVRRVASWMVDVAGVRRGDRVMVSTQKSATALACALGAMRCGAAYLPVGPDVPVERLRTMLERAPCRVVITESSVPAEAAAFVVHPDIPAGHRGAAGAHGGPAPGDVAYVVHTSGSTGRPKGVVVSHGAIASYVAWKRRFYADNAPEVLLQLPSWSFDSSIADIFWALTTGSTLVLVPDDHRLDPIRVVDLARSTGATHLTVVPSLLRVLLPHLGELPDLHCVVVAGEALQPELISQHHDLVPHVALVNEYGPSENSVGGTAMFCQRAGGSVSIGSPADYTFVQVVGDDQRCVPIGVFGELLLSGAGLAEGYLGSQPASSFLVDERLPGGRGYLTGDMGRWLPDGTIEFAGRRDEQVKINGVRVELGDVDAALARVPGVSAGAAALTSGPAVTLGAAITSAGAVVPAAAVRAHLATMLPPAIVPSRIVEVVELPRLASGKVDRRAIGGLVDRPAPLDDGAPLPSGLDRIVPLWADALGIPSVGPDDEFFDLGGESLQAVTIAIAVEREFGVPVSGGDVLDAGTPRALAEALSVDVTPAPAPSRPLATDAYLRHWALHQQTNASAVNHLVEAYLVDRVWTHDTVTTAVSALVEHHVALRTTYTVTARGVEMNAVNIVRPPVSFQAVTDEDGVDRATELVRIAAEQPFDLKAGPLGRVLIVDAGRHGTVVALVVHHLAADGASSPVLWRDLWALLDGGRAISRPGPSPIEHCATEPSDPTADLDYWFGVLHDAEPVVGPRRDHAGSLSFDGEIVSSILTKDATEAIRAGLRASQVSTLTGAVAAAGLVLFRHTGRTDITLGTIVDTRRNDRGVDPAGTHINPVALRQTPHDDLDLGTHLNTVARSIRGASQHASAPFERVLAHLGLSGRPPFETMVTVDGSAAAGTSPVVRVSSGGIARRLDVQPAVSEFPYSFHVDDSGDRLVLSIEFRSALFERATVERWLDDLAALLAACAESPELLVREVLDRRPAPASRDGIVVTDFDGRPVAHGRVGQVAAVTVDGIEITGDLGVVDASGAIMIVCAAADVKFVHGEIVPTFDVERALAGQDDILNAVAIPTGDGRLGVLVEPARHGTPEVATVRALVREAAGVHLALDVIVDDAPIGTADGGDRAAARLRLANETRGDGPPPADVGLPEVFSSVLASWRALLDLPDLSGDTDLIAAGADSIRAIMVASRLEVELQRAVTPSDVLAARTPRELAVALSSATVAPTNRLPTMPATSGATSRLSLDQVDLWSAATRTRAPASWAVTETLVFDHLDISALRSALDGLVARHDVLRARFVDGDPEPLIEISSHGAADEFLTVSSAGGADDAVQSLVDRPWRLDREPPIRALLEFGGDQATAAVLHVCLHHLAVDGWSMSILLDDLDTLYRNGIGDGADVRPLPPAPRFTDFVEAQRAVAADGGFDAELDAWRRRLRTKPPATSLPTDRPRVRVEAFLPAEFEVDIPNRLSKRVSAVARHRGTTPFVVFLAAVHAALAGFGTEQTTTAVTLSGRSFGGVDKLVGLLSTTGIVSVNHDMANDAGDVVDLAAAALDVENAQRAPFALRAEIAERETGNRPHELASVLVVSQGAGPGRRPDNTFLVDSARSTIRLPATTFDLTLMVDATPGALDLRIVYKAELYDRTTIDSFADQIWRAVAAFADEPTAATAAAEAPA